MHALLVACQDLLVAHAARRACFVACPSRLACCGRSLSRARLSWVHAQGLSSCASAGPGFYRDLLYSDRTQSSTHLGSSVTACTGTITTGISCLRPTHSATKNPLSRHGILCRDRDLKMGSSPFWSSAPPVPFFFSFQNTLNLIYNNLFITKVINKPRKKLVKLYKSYKSEFYYNSDSLYVHKLGFYPEFYKKHK